MSNCTEDQQRCLKLPTASWQVHNETLPGRAVQLRPQIQQSKLCSLYLRVYQLYAGSLLLSSRLYSSS